MDDDIIHAVARVEKQPFRVGHAFRVVGREREKCQPHTLFSAHFQYLQFLQRAQNQRVGLGARVNDVNGRRILQHSPE